MFCTKCGKEIRDDAQFCNFCGEQYVNNAIISNEKLRKASLFLD